MKRFWSEVDAVAGDGGWSIRLDGRPVRTPSRVELELPSKALADAVADEWRAVAGAVDPRAMPLTGLANAAIDRVAPDVSVFAAGLARYAAGDLACYRADWPPDLVEQQARNWDPLLAWGRRRFDVDFTTTSGVMPVAQPPATVDRLAHEVAALGTFTLAGLSPLVTIGGSLLAALAMLEAAMPAAEAWAAVSVDDRWQIEQWGADPEATQALANRHRDFLSAAQFLELLEG